MFEKWVEVEQEICHFFYPISADPTQYPTLPLFFPGIFSISHQWFPLICPLQRLPFRSVSFILREFSKQFPLNCLFVCLRNPQLHNYVVVKQHNYCCIYNSLPGAFISISQWLFIVSLFVPFLCLYCGFLWQFCSSFFLVAVVLFYALSCCWCYCCFMLMRKRGSNRN